LEGSKSVKTQGMSVDRLSTKTNRLQNKLQEQIRSPQLL